MSVKKFLLSAVAAVVCCVALFINGGCSVEDKSGNSGVKVVCGLPPVAFIAKEIGGKYVTVQSMLPVGRSPHDYSPRPADIRDAGRSALFFTTGMNFEKNAARAMPDQVKIIDVTTGIRRRHFDDGKGCCDGHGEGHDHNHEALDPHVWLSPVQAVNIGTVVRDALIAVDPEHAEVYRENFAKFKKQLDVVHQENLKRLAPYAGRNFLVYHPAFGYFADAYKLRQHPLEINGREMNAVQLATVIEKANKENIKVVFVQPQFNPRIANELARRINGVAVPLDPLAYDLVENFRNMTDAICRGFEGGKK